MANTSKTKGDTGEREALNLLRTHIPHLLLPGNDRTRSAGIPHDRGDLHALPDATIQVKHWSLSRLGIAITESATTADTQARNDHKPYGFGMVSIAGARKDRVRWLITHTPTNAAHIGLTPVAHFKSVSKLRTWITDDTAPYGYLPYPRTERIATLTTGENTIIVSPIEAWVNAYTATRQKG